MLVKKLDPSVVPIHEPVEVYEAKVTEDYGGGTLQLSQSPGLSFQTTLEGEHASQGKYTVGSKLIVDVNIPRANEAGLGELLSVYDLEGKLIKDRVPDINYARGPVQRYPRD